MITFTNVCKQYTQAQNQNALTDLNFHIDKGEMVFIQGHSGAGKSTLLKLIARIERISQGEIIVDGVPIHTLTSGQIPFYRRRLGMIFQNPMLLSTHSAYDNVAMPLIIAGFNRLDIAKRVRAALDRVGLLHKEKALPHTLSGGEQQRLGIARAIIHKPSILLADEPTGNLDPELSADIMQLFVRFNQVGVTVVIATHDQTLLKNGLHNNTCRKIELKHGQIITEQTNECPLVQPERLIEHV